MSLSQNTPADTPEELPETIHLVNEELENHQIKYHIYIYGTYYPNARYSTNCYKPQCGQDHRAKQTTDDLIEVPTTTLIEHLLPGVCRKCLHQLNLPQPETAREGAEITVRNNTIVLDGGTTNETVLDETHAYRQ